jgi:hypothetical protein
MLGHRGNPYIGIRTIWLKNLNRIVDTWANKCEAEHMQNTLNNGSAKARWQEAHRAARLAVWETDAIAGEQNTPEEQAAFAALCNELIGQDTPEMELDRKRDRAGRINMSENSPETYGQSVAQQLGHYADTFRMVADGVRADAEVDATEQVLIRNAGHNHADEAIAAPLN